MQSEFTAHKLSLNTATIIHNVIVYTPVQTQSQ